MLEDRNLYWGTQGPFRVHTLQPVSCPLGRIVYAGTKWNSRATYAHASPPDFMRPTPHNLLVYTLEGEADYRDDTGIQAVLRKGSLIWTRTGVRQSYGPREGSRWSELFIWFEGSLFDAWQQHGYPGVQSRLLLLEPVDYWTKRFVELVQPPDGTPDESSLLRLCRLQVILAEALQIRGARVQTAETTAWREIACHRLAAGTLVSPSLEEIAESMNMSYSLFRKRFLRLTGTSPGQYRTGELIRRACHQVLETAEPLSAIARQLGFHDPFHFSRRFKEVVGVSPQAFRHQVGSTTRPAKRAQG